MFRSRKWSVLLAIVCLVAFGGCRSLQPKQQGKPGSSRSNSDPGKPPSLKTGDNRQLQTGLQAQRDQLRDQIATQALLGQQVFQNGGAQPVIASPGGSLGIEALPTPTIQTPTSLTDSVHAVKGGNGLDASGITLSDSNGGVALPLGDAALGAVVLSPDLVNSGTGCRNGQCGVSPSVHTSR